MGIFFGILLIAFGISTVRWNYIVANNLREFRFLSTIGGGDIYTGTKFFGIICIFIGLTLVFGLWQAVVNWMLSSYSGLLG